MRINDMRFDAEFFFVGVHSGELGLDFHNCRSLVGPLQLIPTSKNFLRISLASDSLRKDKSHK